MYAGGETRVRLGAALAALALHVLALAAALAVGSTIGLPGKGKADRLTVIALEPPRSRTPARLRAQSSQPAISAMPRAARQVPVPIPGPAAPGPAAAVAEAKALPLPAAAAAPPPPPPPPRAGANVQAALSSYAQTLWQHIAVHRPRGTGKSGTTVVRFRLAPSGALLSAEVAASSGNLNLDKIALRTVRQAVPMPPPPDGATGDQLVFTVPVEFH